jgi:hypothetical protein
MVAHQTVSQRLGIEAHHCILDDGEHQTPVVVHREWLAVAALGSDVVAGAGDLDAQGADMPRSVRARRARGKT